MQSPTTITRWLALTALIWLVLAVLVSAILAGIIQASQKALPEGPAVTGIKLSFLVDRRITRGMYMGDHWISPATYIRVGEGKTVIVPVRAYGLDASRREIKIEPQWKSSNPEVVQMSQAQGHQVEISVLKAGHSDLTVTHGKLSKKLVVKATPLDGTLKVEISQ